MGIIVEHANSVYRNVLKLKTMWKGQLGVECTPLVGLQRMQINQRQPMKCIPPAVTQNAKNDLNLEKE